MAVVLLCQNGDSSVYIQYDRSDEIIANGIAIRKQAFVQRQCYYKLYVLKQNPLKCK